MSPVELLKVKQQVNIAGKMNELTATISQSGGLFSSAAWRGLNATLLRDGIPHGVWFVSYEYAKEYLSEKIGSGTDANTSSTFAHDALTVPILSGAFAATTAWVSFGTGDA
jgi:solute carrier family 25 carnitine/acylcarnitine transporter 20/29